MAVTTTYEGLPYYTAVWAFSASGAAYSNHSIEAQSIAGTAFTILAAAGDYLYLGHQSRFDLYTILLAVAGSLGALTYEYSNSAGGWTQFVPQLDYDFTTVNGVEEWGIRQLVGWTSFTITTSDPHAVSSVPDSDERYYIRISAASVDTAPTVYQIQARPYAYYCTATDVYSLLQLDADFSSSTMPTRDMVEDYIAAAQSILEYRTQKAWRPVVVTNEAHEFNVAGFKLINRDIRQIISLDIWDGADWEPKTEARTSDFFVIDDIGMIHFSRYFLLPARMHSYNAPAWRFGWAEFTMPVRVSYIYGRNKYTDTKQFMDAWNITRKLAAIDIYQSHDYSVLVASGSDKVTLDRKIENWKQEVEEQLDSLRGMIIL